MKIKELKAILDTYDEEIEVVVQFVALNRDYTILNFSEKLDRIGTKKLLLRII